MSAAAGRHVDLLDAHGQLLPSDFRARLQASGSRDYGEDVAERNIGENGLLLGSPAVQKFYETTRSAQQQAAVPRRQTSKYRRYFTKEVIPEHPDVEDAYRPSSRASSIITARSMPVTRTRVTSIFDSPVCTEPRRGSVASSHATLSSIGLPTLEEAGSRQDKCAEESDDDAFPPSIPRFRRSEPESSGGGERPSSALGSVRRARQSVDVMSAYNMGEPINETVSPVKKMLGSNGAHNKRPASREGFASSVRRRTRPVLTVHIGSQKSRSASNSPALQQQNLSVENMLRWRQSFGDLDEDQRSVATERATDSRASQRQWSIASTEPTERSDVSSVNIRPVSRATATTSVVDMRSLMDLDERSSCKTRPSYDVERVDEDVEVDACSITTDGSNVDAFVEKRRRRGAPEDEALLFNESGFFNGGGPLPGLFGLDDVGVPAEEETPTKQDLDGKRDSNQTLKAPVEDDVAPQPPQDARPESRLASPPCSPELNGVFETAASGTGGDTTAAEDDRCSSVATPDSVPGALVPQMYLTQRQRLLALGFDYDTDEEDEQQQQLAALSSGEDAKTLAPPRHAATPSPPLPRLSIIVEAPHDGDVTDAGAVAAARLRRKEAKKLPRGGARLLRVETTAWQDEADGNLADVE